MYVRCTIDVRFLLDVRCTIGNLFDSILLTISFCLYHFDYVLLTIPNLRYTRLRIYPIGDVPNRGYTHTPVQVGVILEEVAVTQEQVGVTPEWLHRKLESAQSSLEPLRRRLESVRRRLKSLLRRLESLRRKLESFREKLESLRRKSGATLEWL